MKNVSPQDLVVGRKYNTIYDGKFVTSPTVEIIRKRLHDDGEYEIDFIDLDEEGEKHIVGLYPSNLYFTSK